MQPSAVFTNAMLQRGLVVKRTWVYAQVVDEFVTVGDREMIEVVVANASARPLRFGVINSRLSIVQEAQDAHGDWRAVEYGPDAYPGNRYETLTLAPKTQWQLVLPRYSGSFPTRMRVRINALGRTFFSNSFRASINPTQFRERDDDLMKPGD